MTLRVAPVGPSHILFVCTANRMRSAFAAAAVEQLQLRPAWLTDVPILSAGTDADEGERAVADAITVARRLRVDLTRHRSQPLTPTLTTNAWVLGFTPSHIRSRSIQGAWRVDLLGSFASLQRIEDPFRLPEQIITNVFQQTLQALMGWAEAPPAPELAPDAAG